MNSVNPLIKADEKVEKNSHNHENDSCCGGPVEHANGKEQSTPGSCCCGDKKEENVGTESQTHTSKKSCC